MAGLGDLGSWTSPRPTPRCRSGVLPLAALRRIADFFGTRHNLDPHWPEESISIDRREFDQVCRELAEAGVPLKGDLEQAWRDFAGWRVNYNRVLLALAALTMAPYAPWSSDRSMIERNGPRNRRRSRSGT